jgi:hypothetical protein
LTVRGEAKADCIDDEDANADRETSCDPGLLFSFELRQLEFRLHERPRLILDRLDPGQHAEHGERKNLGQRTSVEDARIAGKGLRR